jgi:hypothetical protein
VRSLLDPGTDRRPVTVHRLLLTGAVIALISAPVAAASPQWVCYASAPEAAAPIVTDAEPDATEHPVPPGIRAYEPPSATL